MKDVWAMLTTAALERVHEMESKGERIDPHRVAVEVLAQHAINGDDELRLRLEDFIRDMSRPPRRHAR